MRVDTRNGRPAQVVGLPLVVGSTLVVSLLASATRKWLGRLTNRAPIVWTRSAITVLLVSHDRAVRRKQCHAMPCHSPISGLAADALPGRPPSSAHFCEGSV
ncbi:DUF6069 family protein [Nocardia abscessus]|nr:DUF6069 family protein [Nocardia abscessus]